MFYGVNRILLQTFFVAYIVCSLPSCFISFILLQDFLLEGRPPATSLNETDTQHPILGENRKKYFSKEI